ncbi:Cys-tRNA(Pro)/Cys-tRNA(Cys) deacylase [Alicyclobacillus acidoterrestris]|uniref:Cys-tRNA(Pro) deacylase n=1 Tax=Alicyclobacillus suci TaxID=2816080 RepID=UPI001192B98D|nr:Cys-tRNA(Pro) deacylase [Alicyclobacillus suci]GEO27895.1 Cys-tRNA(Pro)/Cys-tRNA(Cys) deacylase [Alicyclobacillus acidoterrestris]
MAAKTIACRILDRQNIPYQVHEYDWNEEALDAKTVAQKVGISPSQIFKTLVLRGDKTGVLMTCIPGDRELDLKAVAIISGNKKVEMVHVKELQMLTGYIRGGVSPLGVKKKYPLYLDESVQGLDPVSISAGRRGLQIFLKGADLVFACEATLGAISR